MGSQEVTPPMLVTNMGGDLLDPTWEVTLPMLVQEAVVLGGHPYPC